MARVLGIVYRCIATHLIQKAGCSRKTAQAGTATRTMVTSPRQPNAGVDGCDQAIQVAEKAFIIPILLTPVQVAYTT
jgi:hypothetical protein